VIGFANVAQIALGAAFSCAWLEDATVSCWGSNRAGQLGDGTQADRAAPTTVTR
jgi:alpha-tubulin suppressor-like RCC1 family protein